MFFTIFIQKAKTNIQANPLNFHSLITRDSHITNLMGENQPISTFKHKSKVLDIQPNPYFWVFFLTFSFKTRFPTKINGI